MRHKFSKVKVFETGVQKSSLVIRNLITSLIKNGELCTSSKNAKVLKSEADKFFASLLRQFNIANRDEKDARREIIRIVKSVVFTEEEGKKVVNELIVKYKEEGRTSGFTKDFKLGPRPGDNAEKVLVRLV